MEWYISTGTPASGSAETARARGAAETSSASASKKLMVFFIFSSAPVFSFSGLLSPARAKKLQEDFSDKKISPIFHRDRAFFRRVIPPRPARAGGEKTA